MSRSGALVVLGIACSLSLLAVPLCFAAAPTRSAAREGEEALRLSQLGPHRGPVVEVSPSMGAERQDYASSTLTFAAACAAATLALVAKARSGGLKRGQAAARCAEAAAKPRVPVGTPVVEHLGLRKRPRRNRRSQAQRDMFRETQLTPGNFILPVFVHEGMDDIPIASMPGVSRLGVDTGLLREVGEAAALGVKAVVIFPKTPDELKTPTAEECFNPDGLAQRAIRNVKRAFPDVMVYTDVALDPYNSLGHDGIVRSDGVILNDETIHYLCKQAVSQAEAGADYVSPSDMMDGRVGAIRDALDNAGFTEVGIMSYSAKYASAFYGPFREALDSNPRLPSDDWKVPDGKETYQQDPGNWRESLLEARLDEEEGADILMVKPAMPYLDIIKILSQQSDLPIAAYHVSGEYAMLKAAGLNGWLDEKAAVLEALLSIKRAGATVILTYYAKEAARWLNEAK